MGAGATLSVNSIQLIHVAMSGGGQEGGQSITSLIIMMALIFGIFYFFVIRPQKQKQEEHESMVESLEPGDRVVTAGGLHGKITGVSDDTLKLQVAKDIKVTVNKSSISSIKGNGQDDET